MMSQRDHVIGVAFFGLTLGGVGAALLSWAGPRWAAGGLAAAFVPAFVVAHAVAELAGAAWDKWQRRTDAEQNVAGDRGPESQ